MIRTTLDNPKFLDLQSRLRVPQFGDTDLPLCFVAGVLEALWIFTARHATDGGVGKWPDAAIARALQWPGSAGELVAALLEARWLDPHEGCRLYVHDWHIHADDAVQRQMARALAYFANGARPKTSRLNPTERGRIERAYAEQEQRGRTSGAHVGARRAPTVRTVGEGPAPPRPAPPGPTRPKKSTAPPPAPAGDEVYTAEVRAVLLAVLRFVRDTYPHVRVPETEPKLRPWLIEVDRLLRLDERSASDVQAVLEWLAGPNQDRGKYRYVVQSPGALREKFPRIWEAMHPPEAVNGTVAVGRAAVPSADDWESAGYGEEGR